MRRAGATPPRIIVIEREPPRAPSDLEMAVALAGAPGLNDWERGFTANLHNRLRRGLRISAKQRVILVEIYQREAAA